ncbi:MAG TPA: type 1 glutamine amidotransferase [Solirubrobacteraceae bacterium]|jgi:GMP synthase-like glutamine amidotransferase|nr:type 1 glutamine amidotransferase [Solirubrobacteraceae bacterium]
MRALVIEHDPGVPAGLVEEWLSGRGADLDVWRIATDSSEPDPGAYDLVVTLGSETAAYDDTVPWVAREQQLLRDAFSADVPVLGICFGSQSLARALGGRAMRAQRSEIGWIEIDSREPSLVPAGPWLQWHHDTFTAPAGATVLAHSAAGPQAYTIGRSLGVQFHPEVTPEIVARWVAGGRGELEREGVDPERLAAEARDYDDDNRARALALFDVFLDRVAAPGSSGSRTR